MNFVFCIQNSLYKNLPFVNAFFIFVRFCSELETKLRMRAAGRSSVIIRSGFLESRYTRRFERQITSTAHKKRHTRRLGYQRRKGGFQLGLRTLPLPILTGAEIPELQAADYDAGFVLGGVDGEVQVRCPRDPLCRPHLS